MDIALASLFVAVIAIILSTATAIRQIHAARSSTHVSLALDVLRQYLEGGFLESEAYVRSSLQDVPVQPLMNMPVETREHVTRVATMYQMVGYLAATKAISPSSARYLFGVNAVQSWNSLRPFIEMQRRADPSSVGYRFFEDLAAGCKDLNPSDTMRTFKLRSFD
jgi:hypothetical protein